MKWAAAASISDAYAHLVSLGCKPLLPLRIVEKNDALVEPAILDATGIGAEAIREVGEMEWFGPILVVQRTVDFQQAVEAAAPDSVRSVGRFAGRERKTVRSV